MTQDERQIEFPFLQQVKEADGAQKMEALFKVRPYDCSKDRHQVLPNGTCMLCRQQILHGGTDGR